jgi:NAD+ kinase
MRVIVRSKNGYGESIRKDVVQLLRHNGVKVTGGLEKGCDFAVLVGGDGTLLRDQPELDCPVLGINPGESVGFYMAASAEDYRKRVESVLFGSEGHDYHVLELMRLKAFVNGTPMPGLALNEVLIAPARLRWILESMLETDGEESLERNSGMIIYTPTGSNAFAHSAGAARIDFDEGRIGAVALAPYHGRLRHGEVLAEGEGVSVQVLCEGSEISLDGSDRFLRPLHKGDRVVVERSGKPLKLIVFGKGL